MKTKLPCVMIVEDDLSLLEAIRMSLETDYAVCTASNGEDAIRLVSEQDPQIVLLDILLPGLDGIEVLRKLKSLKPDAQVIMVTGQDKVRTAVDAMKLGAFDYIHKPFDLQDLRSTVKRAIDQRKYYDEVEKIRDEVRRANRFDNIIGSSQQMQELFQGITRVMNSASCVMVTGEGGTGKELVARAIHYHGNRREGPFIIVNTAAVPDKLLEIELFGQERAQLPVAGQRRDGAVSLAHGGTLFLDEIGDVPQELQSKLLGLIESREYRKTGAAEPTPADVRIVAATRKNLEQSVKDGKFREDLYHRLNAVSIAVPPLRERREDIPLIVYHLIERCRATMNTKVEGFAKEAMNIVKSYNWPGNVRELQRFVEQLACATDRTVVEVEDLPEALRMHHLQRCLFDESLKDSTGGPSLEDIVAAFERRLIEEALKQTNGVLTRAARILGTTRRILKYRVDNLRIPVERESSGSQQERG